MPDPKLIEAMEEIKAVLKKHDVAGVVILGSQSHAEYLFEVSPSWSCATLDENGLLHVRAIASEFGSKEARNKAVDDTVGMFVTLNDATRFVTSQLDKLLVLLSKHMKINGKSTFE
jgi:phosphopantetheinyl transferase (holo-ACP synthase)